jgi:hypothetical protein
MLRSQHPAAYRRGDPLDIPLIDNHLATNLLFPRIISAIRLVLPKLHLDWTTSADGGITNETNEVGSGIKNPLLWKRLVEILLHTSLLLGSSQLLQKRDNDGSLVGNISIRTPAMRNLGMFLKPSSSVTDVSACNTSNKRRLQIDAIKIRLQLYSKLFALVAATVIGPRLYEELKHKRQKQLREQERQRRSIDMHVSSRHSVNDWHNRSHGDRERNRISQRANDRRLYLQTMVSDFIIGAVDVFVPPLRLMNYISYLWGMSSTPELGMRLVGWDYDSFADASSEAPTTGFGQQYQRHANFHYGNRRLLVEEALRTVSVVIPPTESAAVIAPSTGPSPSRGNATNGSGNQLPTRPETTVESQPNLDRRRSWFRKRALSFMGVVEENCVEADDYQHNLTCTKCGTENPTIPYMASCGHYYCYICLRMAVTDDLDCHCLDCGKRITSSHRVDFNESEHTSWSR